MASSGKGGKLRDVKGAPELLHSKPAWWVRLIGALPWVLLYGFASFVTFLAIRIVGYRKALITTNLSKAFPDCDAAAVKHMRHRFYAGFADVFMETFKSSSLSAERVRERVTIRNVELVRERLSSGRSVLLVAAHQCNWEWMLLGLSLDLGFPLDAAYKPLTNKWAEREMYKIRTRFGTRMVKARDLLGDVLRRGKVVRAIAMVADQEPVTSDRKHWATFLNRETAFYVGAEEIARVAKLPVFFVAMRRTSRGHYEMEFQPLWEPTEVLQPGEFTERYVQRVEAQIRAAPPDWLWAHKRWKLKRTIYAQS